MIQRILNHLRRYQTAANAVSERDIILRDVRDARRKLNAAQWKYDGLLEALVWTPAHEKRIELAFKELRLADERYGLMIAYAKGSGVTSGWDDYEEEMIG